MSPIAVSPEASYCHCDVIVITARLATTAFAAPVLDHYDVILIVTSFATELATPTVTTYVTDTLQRFVYRD